MPAARIPKPVAALIKKCWPGGVVEEFATDESWFEEVRGRLERDLGRIRGASLRWQTEEEESNWDDDDFGDPPFQPDWQSYHVFFVAPDAEEFHFEDQTETWEEPDEGDAEEEGQEDDNGTVSGEGWMGYMIRISLATPVAAVNMTSFSRFEDGSFVLPDEPRCADEQYRTPLGDKAFRKLEKLRDKIAAVLAKHKIRILEERILDLRVPNLGASTEVFLQKPLRVRDAFFFHGV